MLPRLLLAVALLYGGVTLLSIPAHAQERLNAKGIVCELDPGCPKPARKRRGLMPRRGVSIEGVVVSDQENSVNVYINFAYNSADLTSDARITLDGLGAALRDPKLQGFAFTIAGHTDAKGGVDFNQKLSERRAASVRDYMISQFGIPAERLTSKGYGKSQLLDPEHPEDGVNRRVQVINTGAAPQQ